MWKIVVLLVANSLAFSQALECGTILNDTTKDFQQVIKTCLLPTIPIVEEKVDNSTKIDFSDDDDPELPSMYGPRRGMGQRTKRQDDDSDKPPVTTTSTSTTQRPTRRTTYQPPQSNIDKNDPKRCVVQCIFKEYTMLDAKELPDHDKVSEGILKAVENRELRDFIQDSIDDCFGQMQEIVDMDGCGYSAKLATCLADKGRYNCADWPIGELPFPHKF